MILRNRLREITLMSFFFLLTSSLLASTAPAWWTEHNVLNSNTPVDEALATQGQAKYMAQKAADAIGEMATLGSGIESIITASWFTDLSKNNLPISQGQLKYMVKPYYDRLDELILLGLIEDGTSSLVGLDAYPWTSTFTSDDSDESPATLGQLKYVFSFILNQIDEDGDGTTDILEVAEKLGLTDPNFDPTDTSSTLDSDGDGKYDWEEFLEGTNPFLDESGYVGPIIYVDSDYGNDFNNGESVFPQGGNSGAKANINAAINQVSTEGTVVILSGSYPESSLDVTDKTVRIVPLGEVRVQVVNP